MDVGGSSRLIGLSCLLLLLMTGCPRPAATVENAVTWGVKAATGQLRQTTPREWQAVAEKIDERTPAADVSLTDEQAEAIVLFVQSAGLDTVSEVVGFLEDALNDPTILTQYEISDCMIDLFDDIDVDAFAGGLIEELPD